MAENNTAVAKAGTAGLKAILAQPAYSKRFEEILGKRAPQFVASIVSVASSLPEDTEPVSIVTSAMVAATLDLPINKDLGFAWIVPYFNGKTQRREAQFQIGHKGFIQLALRTSQYAGLNARAINAEALKGYNEIGEPIIDWEKIDDTKEAAGYMFGWKLVNGFSKICYWSRKRVEAHATKYSQAFKKNWDGPWKNNFNEMALKTVIKNELSDWGILSVEMQRAHKFDQGIVLDVDSEIIHYPDNELVDVPKAQIGEAGAPQPPPIQQLRKSATAPAKQPANTTTTQEPAKDKAPAATGEPAPGKVVDITSQVKPQESENTPENPPRAAPQSSGSSAPPAESSSSAPAPSSSTEPTGAPPAPTAAKAEVPPSKTPKDWLPFIDVGVPAKVVESLNQWLAFEGITDAELFAWAKKRNHVKGETSAAGLAPAKLVGILKARDKIRVTILEEDRATPAQ